MGKKANAQAPETNTGNKQTYAHLPGPPSPVIPEGWVAQYDPAYQRFYYVNLATQRSQWEKPPGTANASTTEAASNEDSNACYQTALPPNLVSQISPPEETTTPHVCFCDRQTAEGKLQNRAGFASKISPFFKCGSSRSELRQQNQPLAYYSPQIAHPQVAYMPQQMSSGMATLGSAALGAGVGLLAGMALENAISSHGDDRYEQGFEDGVEYVRENRSGALEQLEEESIQSEGTDPAGFDEAN